MTEILCTVASEALGCLGMIKTTDCGGRQLVWRLYSLTAVYNMHVPTHAQYRKIIINMMYTL